MPTWGTQKLRLFFFFSRLTSAWVYIDEELAHGVGCFLTKYSQFYCAVLDYLLSSVFSKWVEEVPLLERTIQFPKSASTLL